MAFATQTIIYAQTVGIFYDAKIGQIKFAANDVKTALVAKILKVEMLPLSSLTSDYDNKKVVFTLATNKKIIAILKGQGGTIPASLG